MLAYRYLFVQFPTTDHANFCELEVYVRREFLHTASFLGRGTWGLDPQSHNPKNRVISRALRSSISAEKSRVDCESFVARPICFYPRDAMLAPVFATATCLSVCLDVCHTPVLCLAQRKQDREMYTI